MRSQKNVAKNLSSQKTARGWLKESAGIARPWIALSTGMGSLGGILLVGQAYCIAAIIHAAFMDGRHPSQLGGLFAALALVFVLRAVIAWGRERAGFAAGAMVRRRVREDLLAHLNRLGPVWSGRLSTGAMASAVIEQTEGLHNYVALYLPQLSMAILIPAIVATAVFTQSWAAGAILLITAPLIPLFMVLVGMGAESVSQRHFQSLARMSAHFLDILQGLGTLKIFDRSRSEAENVVRVSADYRRRTMAVLRIAFLSSAVLEFFSAMAIALVAIYLGLGFLGYFEFGAYGARLTFQQGFFILLLAPDFYQPLKELGAHYHARAGALGAAEEILKILNIDSEITAARERAPVSVPQGAIEIEFDDISFDFERGRKALEGVSLRIEPLERIAVVGPSGAGKSTLLHLLLGFIRPTNGRITINGVDLKDITATDLSLKTWRAQIAWVGQHPILFPGTIFENIRMTAPTAADKDVRQAAAAAGVVEFCAHLPQGLDTRVGEQGAGLSKGQAQRVALARAYLKQAPLLLLDEPTAGLDQTTERELIQRSLTIFKDRTVLVVTHSEAALNGMDRVIRLEAGRVVADERGPL